MSFISSVIVNGISLVSSKFTPAVPHATTKNAIFKIHKKISKEQSDRLQSCIEKLADVIGKTESDK